MGVLPKPITREEMYWYSLATSDPTPPTPPPPAKPIDPVLNNNDWETIIYACKTGNVPETWAEGDVKDMDLGTEGFVNAQIVGLGVDERADGKGKAPISWMSYYMLNTYHSMGPNLSGTTIGTGALGGWEKCEMRNYLIDTILPLMPDVLKENIVTVKKYSSGYEIYDTDMSFVQDMETEDKLWIPSYREVYGRTLRETKGNTYTILESGGYITKMKTDGTGTPWWLRSAEKSTNPMTMARSYSAVFNAGGTTSGSPSTLYGVVIGFCT